MDPALDRLRSSFSGRLPTGTDVMAPFLTDWRRQWRGEARAIVQPDTTADVAAVLKWCHATQTPVTPQGGNTSLSGGSVPDISGNAIVLSLTRLKKIREVDCGNDTITVEAGCILNQVQATAAQHNRLFPLSLAAEGSCTMGGVLSTNAGGTAVLRYGNARELCLGIEVVTAQGDVWDGLRGLRKDNTGYDLRGLFIGSEGTLGVITAAVMKLFPAPASRTVAFVSLFSVQRAIDFLEMARNRIGPELTAFELISDSCLDLVLKHHPSFRSPFLERSPWYVLLELTAASDERDANDTLSSLAEAALEKEVVLNAVVGTSSAQSRALWALRENISEAQTREGKNVKHDVSVPISSIGAFIAAAETALWRSWPALRPMVFGHLGDGNLHFNLSAPVGTDAAHYFADPMAFNRIVHDLVTQFRGSISAEHGLGVLRRDEAARYKPSVEVAMMRAIKHALDPGGIMNPGKVLASSAG